MFLMNATPVVALQSKWETFGPSGSFRFPGGFSEPTEGAARAAVSTKVQMVVSTLRGDGAALGMSDAHAVQSRHRGERCRDATQTANLLLPQDPPVFPAYALAAEPNPSEEPKAADSGPLALDSDSDDSVDRDIEKAIQEYLKAKSGAAEGGGRCRPEPPQNSTADTLCTPRPRAASPGMSAAQLGPASPGSVSSDDSFEQSIRAEIEQFLSEKKQHEIQKWGVPVDPQPDATELTASLVAPAGREPTGRALHQDAPGVSKEFIFQKQRSGTQPRVLKARVATEAGAPRSDTVPNRPAARRGAGTGRRAKRAQSAALAPVGSDSSSDDGIEEAIQLYQLEKTRKEASGDAAPRGQALEDTGHDPSPSTTTRSALPETQRKIPSKKKPGAAQATEASPSALPLDSGHPSRPPRETKAPPTPGITPPKSEQVERPSCRADSSAELMCAEAILDISKTILPSPTASPGRPLHAGPLLYTPSVPSRSDGDSSTVDSDDSIEQEIRTFLALKAQSGSLLAQAESCPPPVWSPQSSPAPSGQAGGPMTTPLKTPDLPLSCRRKRKGRGNTAKLSALKKNKEGGRDAGLSLGSSQPGHEGQDTPSQARAVEPEARSQPFPALVARPSDQLVASDGGGQPLQSQDKADEARVGDEKGSSDDKSSSLDSDEDLDTAIKDLLRSKRKLKRRYREPRTATWKKRVRFSTGEVQNPETPSRCHRDWSDRGPGLLKSCLSKSKKDSREVGARSPGAVLGCGVERTRIDTAASGDTALALRLHRRAPEGSLFSGGVQAQPSSTSSPVSMSEDSNSVDSDDSIELEIRKFLAEKAKESRNCGDNPSASPLALGAGDLPRPEALGRKETAPATPPAPPGTCPWSQRGRESSQLAEGLRGAERVPGVQSPARVFGQGLPAAPAKCELVPPRSASGAFSSRGSPGSRRHTHSGKDHSQSGTEPAANEHAFGQLLGGSRASTEAESTGPFQGSPPSLGLLTPNPRSERESHSLLSGPWSDFAQQSRLPSTWALHPDSTWKGGLRADSSSPEGPAKCPSGLAVDPPRSLPFSGFAPLLSTQLLHFGKGVSWGGKQTNLFSSHLGLPLQGPSFSTFREAPLGPSPVFGSPHLLVGKERGHWPSRKSPAGPRLPDRRTSGSEEHILDLRYRRQVVERDEEDQETLGSDASELSDTSVEDSGGRPKGSVLQL
ncbi:PREDICTED: protein phosphatase 1 regulatory subunit 26 [Elephantulus edwardii]|uniref:protein phosphatase 1 regulatory subunit 26 n=1 Tax=Elephantulus edwardii TaxID=28737 RepID=UPI0003F0A696|nr:PREDICTED: protein phosphatase 1 regulatory subunit 26 [Elephantulus edwardii]